MQYTPWQVTLLVYNKGMNNNMNNTAPAISQESIDSLNLFISNYERERDERRERECERIRERNAALYRECVAIRESFRYKATEFACDVAEAMYGMLCACVKIAIALLLILSPAIAEAIINLWL